MHRRSGDAGLVRQYGEPGAHPFLTAPAVSIIPTPWCSTSPGEGTSLVTCAEIGFSLKALLEANELQCFAKVSGSKGLQVYVPLNTKVTYEHTRPFAQSVAVALERQNPKLVVSEMAKNLRHGKIFID